MIYSNWLTSAGQDLRQKLGLHPISSQNTTAIRAAMPSNERAARLFAAGREKLWAFDLASARSLLTEAITADPKFPAVPFGARGCLVAFRLRSQGPQGGAACRRPLGSSISGAAPPGGRDVPKVDSDYPKAVEAYQKLFHIFPDNLDYGLLLASAQKNVSIPTLANAGHASTPSPSHARRCPDRRS